MDFTLILKKLNGTLTEAESKDFENWFQESELHRQYFEKVSKNWGREAHTIDVKKAWEELNSNLSSERQGKSWKIYIAAASIALVFGTILYNQGFNKTVEENPVVEYNQIVPGGNNAVLTLRNGEQIDLVQQDTFTTDQVSNNGKNLIYSGKTEGKPAYNYLTIPRGGQYQIQLSDGTRVWMNSESKLKYPTYFETGVPREVELVYGEAYFDVSGSENHNGDSFRVKTGIQNLEVLGTEFNISAYQDQEDIATTLVEGKIAVTNTLNGKVLTPGQQSKISPTVDDIKIENVEVSDEIAWKKGMFSFRNKSLAEITQTLSRWYNVDFKFMDQEKKSIRFSGQLERTANITDLLTKFQKTGDLNFTVEERTITIK